MKMLTSVDGLYIGLAVYAFAIYIARAAMQTHNLHHSAPLVSRDYRMSQIRNSLKFIISNTVSWSL